IILVLMVLSLSGCGLFAMQFVGRHPFRGWVQLAEAGTALVGLLFGLFGVVFSERIQDWLHILMDVINHFYERIEPAPWPWEKFGSADVSRFEIQQNIEYRFRRALQELLDDPEVSHLTIVSHSQGTVIALDVLAMPNCVF